MVQLVQVLNPVVSHIEVCQVLLLCHVLDLANKVMVQVKFAEFRVFIQSFNLFNFVERQNQSQQVGQTLHALYLLDLVVEKIKIDDATDLVFATYFCNQFI